MRQKLTQTAAKQPWQQRIEEDREKKIRLNQRKNGIRRDEEHALRPILQWCTLNSIILLPTDNQHIEVDNKKPDYVFSHNNALLMIEVRQLGSGSIAYQNDLIDKSGDDHQLFNLYERLTNSVSAWIDGTQTIILIILCPLESLLKHKQIKKLNEALKKAFYGNINTEKIYFEELSIEAVSTNFYHNNEAYSPLKIIPALSLVPSENMVHQNSLTRQTMLILLEAIGSKENKYRTVSMFKWLALINTHPLLNINDYQAAYDQLKLSGKISYIFTKIFIIKDERAYLLI